MPFVYSQLNKPTQSLYDKVVTIFSGIGWKVVPTSGYRSPSHNAKVKGASKSSQHMDRAAFDFVTYDKNGKRVDPYLVQATLASSGLDYGQNIAEFGSGAGVGVNHISVPNDARGIRQQNKHAHNGKYSWYKIPQDMLNKGRLLLGDASNAIGIPTLFGLDRNDPENKDIVGSDDGSIISDLNPFAVDNKTVKRLALAVVAIILIAAAIFSFKVNDIAGAAKTLVK